MLNEPSYWENFYKNEGRNIKGASPFLLWCLSNYKDVFRENPVIDLCCGNGRDTYTLKENCPKVIGIDSGMPKEMASLYLNTEMSSKPDFYKGTLDQFVNNRYSFFAAPDYILYCRFGFHAMEYKDLNKCIGKGFKYIFAEMRSDAGTNPDNTHKRTFINGSHLIEGLLFYGYKILYFHESTGFSPTFKEDPLLIRIVAKSA
jgi:hypothetical protein